MDLSFRNRVLLTVQQAFLYEITREIRCISLVILEKTATIKVYFDGEISKETIEEMSCVETEIMAAFPENEIQLLSIRMDYPSKIPFEGLFSYMRKEP